MWKPFSYSPIFRICFYAQRQTSSRLYLDPAVPGGISIFVTLAEKEGIRTGLECLGADIGSGRIDQVRDRFDSDQVDSLFSSRKRKTEEVGGFEPRVSRPARRVRLVSLGDFRSDVLRGRVTKLHKTRST